MKKSFNLNFPSKTIKLSKYILKLPAGKQTTSNVSKVQQFSKLQNAKSPALNLSKLEMV